MTRKVIFKVYTNRIQYKCNHQKVTCYIKDLQNNLTFLNVGERHDALRIVAQMYWWTLNTRTLRFFNAHNRNDSVLTSSRLTLTEKKRFSEKNGLL